MSGSEPLGAAAAGTAGGAWGALAALVLIAALVLGGWWADRRVDRWLARVRRSPLRPLRAVAQRPLLARAGLWIVVGTLSLVVAAWLSGLVAWILGPAAAVALALAAAPTIRDLALGAGAALTTELRVGDHVAVGAVEGEVTRIGLRGIELRTVDGGHLTLTHGRLAREGVRRLTAAGGGYPVDLTLALPVGIDLAGALEAARLAACLAPHAHLGARPTVTLGGDAPPTLHVRGYAIDPFSAGPYRGEVLVAFREAVRELAGEGAVETAPAE